MTIPKIQALLFDLGGVLIEVDFDRAFEHWQPISKLSFAELKTSFKQDPPYQQHERGEITVCEYFEHLCAHLQLQEDYAHIASGWNAIFPGEIAGMRRLLQAARAQLPCYLLSNTNAMHQETWSALFPEITQCFERLFVSSALGCRKPERKAFDAVIQALAVPPDSIMFFDDLLENVEGAAAAGLTAVHVQTPDDVRAALKSIGYVF